MGDKYKWFCIVFFNSWTLFMWIFRCSNIVSWPILHSVHRIAKCIIDAVKDHVMMHDFIYIGKANTSYICCNHMQQWSLREILYFVMIQFMTTWDYPSFATIFYNFTTSNHLFIFLIIFATMVPPLDCTSFHIDFKFSCNNKPFMYTKVFWTTLIIYLTYNQGTWNMY